MWLHEAHFFEEFLFIAKIVFQLQNQHNKLFSWVRFQDGDTVEKRGATVGARNETNATNALKKKQMS